MFLVPLKLGSRSPRTPCSLRPQRPPTLSAPFACRALELSQELSRVSLERDSLSRELLRTIRQKVALTQELEAWQVRGEGRRGGAHRRRGWCADPPFPPGDPPAGRHASGDRAAAALPTPERAERSRRVSSAAPCSPLLAAPGSWARRRLLQQSLPKDLRAWPRGPAKRPVLALSGSLSSSGQWSNRASIVFQRRLGRGSVGTALGTRGPRWVAGQGEAEQSIF